MPGKAARAFRGGANLAPEQAVGRRIWEEFLTDRVSSPNNRVPVIVQLVQADEDTVRDVIHRFNQIGPACLDPRWAGGRPRLLSPDDEDFVVQTATTRPTKLSQPFTRWSIRKLLAYLRKVHGRVIRIGGEALR
ncbi:helix-turn-helix domain-containing protein [Micromonospora rhizosphaerae]|uniref:helix-turn-helix domain-containing protein n=1 Tax=Micromonospora rhizosphaerae TaxID=568872 RepID=UPI000A771423